VVYDSLGRQRRKLSFLQEAYQPLRDSIERSEVESDTNWLSRHPCVRQSPPLSSLAYLFLATQISLRFSIRPCLYVAFGKEHPMTGPRYLTTLLRRSCSSRHQAIWQAPMGANFSTFHFRRPDLDGNPARIDTRNI